MRYRKCLHRIERDFKEAHRRQVPLVNTTCQTSNGFVVKATIAVRNSLYTNHIKEYACAQSCDGDDQIRRVGCVVNTGVLENDFTNETNLINGKR